MHDAVSHFKLAHGHRHAGATFNLGLCYECGVGVEKDLRKAMRYYRDASALGHAKAMYNLGIFYAQGRGGLRRNRSAARECFVAAATLGSLDARRSLAMKREVARVKIKSNSLSDEGYKSDPGQYGHADRKETWFSSLKNDYTASAAMT